jgi:hypothetical protein
MRGSRIRSENIAQVVAPRSLNSPSFDAEQVASFDVGQAVPTRRPLSSGCDSYFDDVCHLMLASRTLKTAPSKPGFIWLNAKEPHWCTTFRTKRTHSDCHRTIGKMDHWGLRCPDHFDMGIAPRLVSSQLRVSNNTKFDQMA